MAPRLRRAAWVAACAVLLPSTAAYATSAPLVTIAGTGENTAYPGAAGTLGSFPSASTVPFRSAAGIGKFPFGDEVVFADPLDHRVLQVTPSGTISVVVGTGTAGSSNGEAGLPYTATFNGPQGVGLFTVGYVFADTTNRCTRKITGAGVGSPSLSTDAGLCSSVAPPTQGSDGTPPTSGTFASPVEIEMFPGASDSLIEYYVADGNRVRAVTGSGGTRALSTVAGSIDTLTPPADNTSPTGGYIGLPQDVAVTSSSSTFYIASYDFTGLNRVFKVTGGKIFTVAGLGTGALGDGGNAVNATLSKPTGVVALADGGLLVYDGGHGRIRRISGDATPQIETIAGTGTVGFSPDGTPADAASLRSNGHMALFANGLVFTQSDVGVGGQVRRIPATAITSGPSGFVASTSATFGLGSWDDAATFQCRVDLGSFGPCASLTGLTEAQHTFEAKATTNDGTLVDTSGTTRKWTVDVTQPAEYGLVAPAAGAPGLDPRPVFSWNASSDANGVARYELWIDDAKSVDAGTTTQAQAPAPLSEGEHHWQVKAFDAAGNMRPSEMRAFTVSSPPSASFTVSPNPALAGRTVTFDGSGSSDANGPIARWEWDLDGDGSFETDGGGSPTTSRSYDSARTITVRLRVTDGAANQDTTTRELKVTDSQSAPPAQLGVTINNGAQYTRTPDVTVTANFPSTITALLVSNDGGFLTPSTFAPQKETKWKLDSSGPERLPKIVYVRFLTGPFPSETHTDDIILDETPPKVDQASILPSGGGAASISAAKTLKWRVSVKATDSNSGVQYVQVTANKRKPGRLIGYKRKLTVKSKTRPKFLRARDKAGNFSPWRTAKKR